MPHPGYSQCSRSVCKDSSDEQLKKMNDFLMEIIPHGNGTFNCFYGFGSAFLDRQYSVSQFASHILWYCLYLLLLIAVWSVLSYFCCCSTRNCRHSFNTKSDETTAKSLFDKENFMDDDQTVTTNHDSPASIKRIEDFASSVNIACQLECDVSLNLSSSTQSSIYREYNVTR